MEFFIDIFHFKKYNNFKGERYMKFNSPKNVSNTINTLNIINSNPTEVQMGLTEYRFFCLYLSKLNAQNLENRTVLISIKEFEELFKVKFNTTIFTNKIYQILKRSVIIKSNDEKIKIINLYSNFAWYENMHAYLEVTCNYDVVPYLFELKNYYTSYMLLNIAKLNSISKIRLYEIGKQHINNEKIKIELTNLQDIMCCGISVFKDFNQKTLKPAINDINKYTDINISYKKILTCRRVSAIEFTITPKEDMAYIQLENQIVNY